jgi:hypothetical protein
MNKDLMLKAMTPGHDSWTLLNVVGSALTGTPLRPELNKSKRSQTNEQ